MKQDETRDTSSGDGDFSVDAEEVRRRVVRAFAQMVGDAMSEDWTRQSLELAKGAAADAAQAPQEDPIQERLGLFRLPPPRRHLAGKAEDIPVMESGIFTRPEWVREILPYLHRPRMIKPSALDDYPYAMVRPLVSRRVGRIIGDPYGAGLPSPLDADYSPLTNSILLGSAGTATVGLHPTDVASTPSVSLLAKRWALTLLFSGDSYGAPRSLYNITPAAGLRKASILPGEDDVDQQPGGCE